ncbi:hypothetical protein ANN_24059 [Periplaneta americana]|uniref:Per a allergen n=1 Tax=Periplaneta americana TaxID=6978 RepID=A0ABQ8S2H2_PERAM|nr:hypothetical protein ANN_24059 [Periplaneta americana]
MINVFRIHKPVLAIGYDLNSVLVTSTEFRGGIRRKYITFFEWIVYIFSILNCNCFKKKVLLVEEEVFCLATNGSSRRIDIIAYSQTTKKGCIIDPTIRIETGSSQPEDVNQEKINIYLPTVDYFKVKYQHEDIEVIGLLIGARGVIPKFFESFRKTFELPQTITTDIITSVLKRSCQILSHHIHFLFFTL